MIDIDDFEIQKEIEYKGELFSVRDNGAIMRHPKNENRVRKLDNIWTFGRPDVKTGYMLWGEHRVHRIVAFAFHGQPPSKDYVVDHIDTNRRNNRPDNLRWLTRLENVLNNPITRARIENVCGSIRVFLQNPSVLKDHTRVDPNFDWMRQVTKEEAQYTLKRLIDWANDPNRKASSGQGIGDWIYKEFNTKAKKSDFRNTFNFPANDYSYINEPARTQSLTSNAIQLNWKNAVEFPLCPLHPTMNPLKEYLNNIKVGDIFSKNKLGISRVLDFGMRNEDELWILSELSVGFMSHGITKITYKDNIFYHENMGLLDLGDEPEELFNNLLNRK